MPFRLPSIGKAPVSEIRMSQESSGPVATPSPTPATPEVTSLWNDFMRRNLLLASFASVAALRAERAAQAPAGVWSSAVEPPAA